MKIIQFLITLLTCYCSQVEYKANWVLLEGDLKYIKYNLIKIVDLENDIESNIYQSFFNITTINIGYIKYRIVIDLYLLNYKASVLNVHADNTNFSNIQCIMLNLENHICSLEQTAQQQNYIEILFQLGYKYQIKNLQIYLFQCKKNCALCKNQSLQCLKCKDQYILDFVDICQNYDQKELNEGSLNFQYLHQHYRDYVQFEDKKKLLEFPNGQDQYTILDSSTSNRIRQIMVNQNNYIGPFAQNEGIKYSNLNITLIEKIDIRIDFSLFILYDSIDKVILYHSINGFELELFIFNLKLSDMDNCTTTSFINCKILNFQQFYYNITQIDSIQVQGSFGILQQNRAWVLGNIKVFQIEKQKCQFKTYKQFCLKQCPIGTLTDNNTCLDKITDKFIDIQNIEFIEKLEFLNDNHFFFDRDNVFFNYEDNSYQVFQKSIMVKFQLKQQMRIFFKLIIVDADINEQIIVNLANYTSTYNVSNLELLKTQIGDQECSDYFLDFQNTNLEFGNNKGLQTLQIIRKGSQYAMSLFISELVIIYPNCAKNCENCKQNPRCNAIINNDMNCPQGQQYFDFDCQWCSDDCTKYDNYNKCLDCREGYVLFSGVCYKKNKQKFQHVQELKLCFSQMNCKRTDCNEENQVRNIDKCICQDGYFLNAEFKCIPCIEQCLTCVLMSNHCTSCKLTENRQLQTGQCICEEGYYESNRQQCQKCSQKCKQCQYKEFICTECHSSQHKILKSNDCVCQEGYYHDFIQDICLQCSSTCKSCKDFSTCLSCNELQNRILTFSDQCICKQGYFLNDKECVSCHYTCLECLDSSEFNKCSKCGQNRKRKKLSMDYFQCICQVGYYDVGEQLCKNCQLLDNPPKDHYCYAKCGDGIIQWNEECDNLEAVQRDECHQCKLSQSKCQIEICQVCDQQECTQCYDGYFLKEDFSCDKCSPICKTCKINPYNCIICADNNLQCSNCLPHMGYQYHKNSCQSICGDGYLTLEEQCDDGNLIDNDGCNSKCQIEYNFICGNTCINKPIMNFQIEANKSDKYYSNQRHFKIKITNFQYNIQKEQLQLSFISLNQTQQQEILNNINLLNYTINKQSNQSNENQEFFITLFLNQSSLDLYLNLLLLNGSVVIYEKKIQIINYFTLHHHLVSIYDSSISLFKILLQFYSIIFLINFIFIRSNQYFEILFLFQLLSYQNQFYITYPKYFDSFLELFVPYQMTIFQQSIFVNNDDNQSEQQFNPIVKQHLIIIIFIIVTSLIHSIVYLQFRIKKKQIKNNYQDILLRFYHHVIYQLIYFLNYFSQTLYFYITQNNSTIQNLIYILFYTISYFKIYAYFRNYKPIMCFIVLFNVLYIFVMMMKIKIKIYQLILLSLINGIQLLISIISKKQFQLKYKLLLGNFWVSHFFYIYFELYQSSIQKYEKFNQILGGVLIINYFALFFLLIFDILNISLKKLKVYCQQRILRSQYPLGR